MTTTPMVHLTEAPEEAALQLKHVGHTLFPIDKSHNPRAFRLACQRVWRWNYGQDHRHGAHRHHTPNMTHGAKVAKALTQQPNRNRGYYKQTRHVLLGVCKGNTAATHAGEKCVQPTAHFTTGRGLSSRGVYIPSNPFLPHTCSSWLWLWA